MRVCNNTSFFIGMDNRHNAAVFFQSYFRKKKCNATNLHRPPGPHSLCPVTVH